MEHQYIFSYYSKMREYNSIIIEAKDKLANHIPLEFGNLITIEHYQYDIDEAIYMMNELYDLIPYRFYDHSLLDKLPLPRLYEWSSFELKTLRTQQSQKQKVYKMLRARKINSPDIEDDVYALQNQIDELNDYINHRSIIGA